MARWQRQHEVGDPDRSAPDAGATCWNAAGRPVFLLPTSCATRCEQETIGGEIGPRQENADKGSQ
jgi:hypothetical protein